MRAASWIAAGVVTLALAGGPGRPFLSASDGAVGKASAMVLVPPRAARRQSLRGVHQALAAAPWDILFGKEDVELPSSTEQLVEGLQSSMMTAVEKALPRIDMELPPGLRLGIEGKPGTLAMPPGEVTLADAVRGDRELAAAFVMLFDGLKNGRSLCVAFRDEKLAARAKRVWRDTGTVKVTALPNPKRASIGGGDAMRAVANRPFLVAVAPTPEQLVELKALDEARGEKLCIILLNARLRGLKERDELREELAAGSNPAYHVRLAGADGRGVVYHQLGSPWVVARRKSPEGELEEISRSDDEPTSEEIEAVLVR